MKQGTSNVHRVTGKKKTRQESLSYEPCGELGLLLVHDMRLVYC